MTPRATRCAAIYGTRFAVTASRSRIRSRSNTAARNEPADRRRGFATSPIGLAEIDLFTGLDDVDRARLAEGRPEHLFGAGERIVRQGDAGQSMFVVLDGRVRITLEPSGQEVAVTSRGGFFGEMSMLTGDPRTATVSALDDAHLLEISAQRFRDLAVMRHGLVEHVSELVSARRAGLASARAAAEEAQAGATSRAGLLERIKKYLSL